MATVHLRFTDYNYSFNTVTVAGSKGAPFQPNRALDNYLRISFRAETNTYLVIEISWELGYCHVSNMPFLEPLAWLVWLGPILGIYSWADVAAEGAAH